jgi:uncharacterized protein (DUF983 family)
MYYCDRCAGEFEIYSAPGKCPLCDQWVGMECTGCRHAGSSRRFIEAGDKCPKCGRDANIPGRKKTSYLLVAGLIVVIVAFIFLVYVFATFEATSRPLPDLHFRPIEIPS